MDHVSHLILLAAVFCGSLWAIDGLAARPSRPSYLAREKGEAPEKKAEQPRHGSWGGMFGTAYVPVESLPEKGEGGKEPKTDSAAEMKSTTGGKGVPIYGSTEPGPKVRVHGEMGVTGGGAGSSTYGTVVAESNKAAITVSGERYRSWWP